MEPLGITLFCDDIRFEQHNKLTFVGCYGPEMLVVGHLPLMLPRLGLYVQLRLPPGSSSPSKILIFFPDSKDGEPAVTVDIAPPNVENIKKSQQPIVSDTVSLLATNVPIILGPVLINAPGLIKVRVQWGDKIIKSGTLNVKIGNENDAVASL